MPRGPSKATKEKRSNASLVAEEDIQKVFSYWVETFSKKRAVLDEKRRTAIGSAIHFYGVEMCCDAIRGCSMSDFHMGRNAQNKKYTDIELILRDAQHVERFIGFLPEDDDAGPAAGREPW